MESSWSDDPTTLSYWLRWKVLLCAISVVTPMIAAFFIWKYEHLGRRVRKQDDDASWKPCLRNIHPVFLLLYRIFAFSLLIVAMGFDLGIHGFQLFLYYTQWTFTLVTFYFGLGSLLSFYGCFYHLKITNKNRSDLLEDVEDGDIYSPLVGKVDETGNGLSGKSEAPPTYGFWDYLFQAVYQMTAGAVTLTDSVYWIVIFPFLSLRDYKMNFLTVVTHTMNAVLLIGDTALNRLQFPCFGFSYFILLTGIYVVFQWIIHACINLWWPYPFLDLSAVHAPIWYLIVAAMHLPCYYLYFGVSKVKNLAFSRCFPDSYMH